MKRIICSIMAAACFYTAFPQVANISPVKSKTIAMPGVKMVSLEPVTNNIHLISPNDLLVKTPTASENLNAEMQKLRANCPLLLAEIAIKLDGERQNNDQALLDWKVENALYSQLYILERSLDDTFHFQPVAQVWPTDKIGLKEQYTVDDNNSFQLMSFYRVKLQLASGKLIYSNIAAVNGYTQSSLRVFPNPARSVITVTAFTDIENIEGVTIMDGSGKIIWQQSGLPGQKNFQKQISLSNFSTGTYFIKADLSDNTRQQVSFIKQ